MIRKIFGAVSLAVREAIRRPSLARTPESPMDADAFDDAGTSDGVMLGVYHFNALAVHALAPAGGTVVDLGCGSGRFLATLAHRRPDLRIIGIDLDPKMLELGRRLMSDLGLKARVELIESDMTAFARHVPPSVSVISAIFSLHHLPTLDALRACVRQISKLSAAHHAGVWIFDHARPKNKKTAEAFPVIFSPEESAGFKKLSSDSLIASWSFEELRQALSIVQGLHGRRARFLPLYQIHWAAGRAGGSHDLFRPPASLSPEARRDARALSALFAGGLPRAHPPNRSPAPIPIS